MKQQQDNSIIQVHNAPESNNVIPFPPPECYEPDADETRVTDIFPDKIPIEKLKAIWNDSTTTYTDSELYRIRDWLYTMAEAVIEVADRHKDSRGNISFANPPSEPKQISFPPQQATGSKNRKHNIKNQDPNSITTSPQITPLTSDDNNTPAEHQPQKSHPLRPRIYRRAG